VNKTQRAILIIVLVIDVLSILFPPCTRRYWVGYRVQIQRFAGYHSIFFSHRPASRILGLVLAAYTYERLNLTRREPATRKAS
jgi:hypothetical protein